MIKLSIDDKILKKIEIAVKSEKPSDSFGA